MPQRIIIVIGSLQVGGAERQIAQIVPRLDQSRWQVDLVTLSQPGSLAEDLVKAGHRVWSPPLATRITRSGPLIRLLRAMITVPWLWFWFLRKRPDVAHFILPEAYLIGGLCAVLAGQSRMIMSRRSLSLYQARHPILARIERQLHKRMTVIVANSEAIRRDLLKEGVPDSRTQVILNGVDTSAIRPDGQRGAELRRSMNIAPKSLVLMIVANLIPYKGHADLIDALARIRDTLPEGWQLLCVGRDDGIGGTLQAKCTESGLSSHVQFLGSRSDIPALLNVADISLLCSHEEGLPNAVIEAMAAGVPTIATDVGGTGEIIDHGITGLLIPPHNPTAMAQSILDLVQNTALRDTMGHAARAEIERTYGMDICARAYDDLYQHVVTPGPQGNR
ncbi:MAG: glycosyltransferase [Rhodospirillaceae bacterium]|nr:glycosyltransferase [Rhodospirillaceae bacterium]MBT7360568.1 glycosyltransferase [Rhodospirillaceae bacterium]